MTLDIQDGHLSEALALLSEHTDMLECRCPAKLIGILRVIREFTPILKRMHREIPGRCQNPSVAAQG